MGNYIMQNNKQYLTYGQDEP